MYTHNGNKKIIMHIDGDAFFAACEIMRRPELHGKPVVVGADKGIATALSYEAKALGISRTMPMFQIKKYWPQVVCLPTDFSLYNEMSFRMRTILSRYVSILEEYSIDECFADITHDVSSYSTENILNFAQNIQNALKYELGITYSIGISSTKVQAKIASKKKKPSGITVLDDSSFKEYAQNLPIGSVWGIGKSSVLELGKHNISTVADFCRLNYEYVQKFFAKPLIELWYELQGISVMLVHAEHDIQKSYQDTRMFEKRTQNLEFIFSELVTHVEAVCKRARVQRMQGKRISWFVKTQAMTYIRSEIILPRSTAIPTEIISYLRTDFEKRIVPHIEYRSSGVTLSHVNSLEDETGDLFRDTNSHSERYSALYATIDALHKKYKKHTVVLASSQSMNKHSSRTIDHTHNRYPLIYLGNVY